MSRVNILEKLKNLSLLFDEGPDLFFDLFGLLKSCYKMRTNENWVHKWRGEIEEYAEFFYVHPDLLVQIISAIIKDDTMKVKEVVKLWSSFSKTEEEHLYELYTLFQEYVLNPVSLGDHEASLEEDSFGEVDISTDSSYEDFEEIFSEDE